MRGKDCGLPSVSNVDLSADTIELFLGRNVLGLGRLDHHLILLVAPGKRMVEGDVIAALHITSRDIKAEIIDDGSQRGDSVQLLEANLLNMSEQGMSSGGSIKRVVSFVDHFKARTEQSWLRSSHSPIRMRR